MTNKEFKKLFFEVNQMRERYFNTLASHKIFEQFNKLATPNIVGKRKAEKNVKIFGKYVYFFTTIKEATRCYFLIELAKFFDVSKNRNQTRTVYWTLEYARKNLHRLTKKDFLIYHDKLEFSSNSYENFEDGPVQDIERLMNNLSEHEKR